MQGPGGLARVLDAVPLVQDGVVPLELAQYRLPSRLADAVRGDQNGLLPLGVSQRL